MSEGSVRHFAVAHAVKTATSARDRLRVGWDSLRLGDQVSRARCHISFNGYLCKSLVSGCMHDCVVCSREANGARPRQLLQ